MDSTSALYTNRLSWFRRGAKENREFWKRMGEMPDFRGARVLEIGCGVGCLATEIALQGASKVVGVDIQRSSIDFAQTFLRQKHPELAETVEFLCRELKDCEESDFDVVVTKDTFEHVMDLEGLLPEIKLRLRHGGRLYAGFGPLYPSPYGDHDRRRTILEPWGVTGRVLSRIPWSHMVLEPVLVRMRNRAHSPRVQSLRDLGLNKLAFSEYRELFMRSGLVPIQFRTNRSSKRSSKVLSVMRRVPLLEDLCTHNVYCILEKWAP